METLIAILAGLGLSAACGFRVFIPMLGMSYGAMNGYIEPGAGFEWIGSWPALITFLAAALFEIASYYIPWVDNLMDTVTTPLAIAAGVIATASMADELSPVFKWVLAIVGGGGISGLVQVGTVALRAGSSGTTGGLGNPVVSTFELISSIVATVLAIVIPIICILLVSWIAWRLIKRRKRARRLEQADATVS